MKIKKVSIESFGAVKNFTTPELEDNMTVIYGPNEAGKSTITEFIRGTLFPVRTVKYPTPSKSDSGTIEIEMDDGERRTLRRDYKKVTEVNKKKTIAEEFSNLDSDTYRSLYGLDLEQLTNNKILSSGDFKNKFLTVAGGEAVPEVSEEIEDRLNELMNKERMTDNKIIGGLLSREKDIENEMAGIGMRLAGYDGLLIERTDLERTVAEKKRLKKIGTSTRAKNEIMKSQSSNIARLESLKSERNLVESSRDFPLEQKTRYDSLKKEIEELEKQKETIPKVQNKEAILEKRMEIEKIYNSKNTYLADLDKDVELSKAISSIDSKIDSIGSTTGWTLEEAKNVKLGRSIINKAEAEKRRMENTDGVGKNVLYLRFGLIGLGIILAIVSFIIGLSNIAAILLLILGILSAAAGIFITKLFPKLNRPPAEFESQWPEWIHDQGYPASTTPDLAIALVPQLEKMISLESDKKEMIGLRESCCARIDSYSNNVRSVLSPLGIDASDVAAGIDDAHIALEAAILRESNTVTYDKILSDLTTKKSELTKLVRRYGGEEAFLTTYQNRLELDELDKDISVLSQSIEGATGVSINELMAFLKGDINVQDQEFDDDTDECNTRIGEINAEMKSLMNDDKYTQLQTERDMIEAKLDDALYEWSVYSLAAAMIRDSSSHFYSDLQPDVVKEASQYLRTMTDGKYQLDSDPRNMEITIKDDYTRKTSSQWSSGLSDQVYLAMRMALAKEMGTERMPMIMDDVLVRFDSERKKDACRAIYDFSRENQVILFTCDNTVRNYFAMCGRFNEIKL